MSKQTLHFHFDYLSAYAWLAWREVTKLCDDQGLELVIHPVVFGKLLDHWGQLGPAEIPPKREMIFKTWLRYCALHDIPFNPPKVHPFNPLPALRVSLPEVAGIQQRQVVDAIFDAGWTQGQDIGDPQVLVQVLSAAGLDGAGLIAQVTQPGVKAALVEQTQTAINQQVFGVPTMIVDDELFWGLDQLPFLRLFLQGQDPLDRQRLGELCQRPRGIDRARG